MSAISNLSWSGQASSTYGQPYFPSPEEKAARQAADAERAERNRKAATRRAARESRDDFKLLRAEILDLLGQWHRDHKRVLRLKMADIRSAIVDHYKEMGREGPMIGQAATSAITAHFDVNFDEVRQKRKATRCAAEKARLEQGYRWTNAELLGGKYRVLAFTYHGLRSNEHFWFRHFLSLTPSLRSGNYASSCNKEFVGAYDADSKLLALDDAWIDINKEVIGLLKQDVDAVFMSWAHLRQEILDRNLPLPHIAVAYTDDQGRVHNPHLVWFLPKSQGVRTDAAAFEAPQKLYKSVQRGLCNELMAIGGDPGGLINFGRMKNPLSPLWSVRVLSEQEPLSLRQWTNIVDIEVYFEPLMRSYSTVRAIQDGADATASNQAFMTLKRAAFQLLMAWYHDGDSRFIDANRNATASHIVEELGSMARHVLLNGAKPQASMAILQRVATYTATNFDIEKAASYRANKGILSETLPEGMSGKARMAEGGRYGARKRSELSLMAMVEAAVGIEMDEKELSKAGVIEATGLARATVHRKWSAMLSMLSDESLKQAIVRKKQSLRTIEEPPLFSEAELDPARGKKKQDQAAWDSVSETERHGNLPLAFRVLGAAGAIAREKNRKEMVASKMESHSGHSKKEGMIPDSSKDSSFALDRTVSVSPSNDNGDHGLNSWLAWHSDCPVDDIIETDLLIPEAA